MTLVENKVLEGDVRTTVCRIVNTLRKVELCVSARIWFSFAPLLYMGYRRG